MKTFLIKTTRCFKAKKYPSNTSNKRRTVFQTPSQRAFMYHSSRIMLIHMKCYSCQNYRNVLCRNTATPQDHSVVCSCVLREFLTYRISINTYLTTACAARILLHIRRMLLIHSNFLILILNNYSQGMFIVLYKENMQQF